MLSVWDSFLYDTYRRSPMISLHCLYGTYRSLTYILSFYRRILFLSLELLALEEYAKNSNHTFRSVKTKIFWRMSIWVKFMQNMPMFRSWIYLPWLFLKTYIVWCQIRHAKFHKLIPFSRGADGVKVAMETLTDKVTIAALEENRSKIVVYYATEKDFAQRYSFINEMFKKYMRILWSNTNWGDAPVTAIVDMLLHTAVDETASDIHIGAFGGG